jgi:hypothetical protein
MISNPFRLLSISTVAIWLFDPNSPWIATFNAITPILCSQLLRILFSLATSSACPAPYHTYGPGTAHYDPGKLEPAIVLGERKMLWTITIILFILWVVGLVSSYTLGGWIHILLVLAIIVLIFNLMSGRRVV